jgi:predicted RNA binding protein YcfA (HicA-like mRNA interferase family)
VKDLPNCSSQEVVDALTRAGFRPASRVGESHQAFVRTKDGQTYVTIVVMDKPILPRLTLRSIIASAGLTVAEFRGLLT